MASEEFYGDGGDSGSGSEYDDEPFEVQSPIEKIRLILHSFDTVTPLDVPDKEEFTKKKEQAKALVEIVKQLVEGDYSRIEDFKSQAPAIVNYAAKLPSYEIFYEDFINIYEDKKDDAETPAEKEKIKAILTQLKDKNASAVTQADKDLVYKTLVESFL